MIKTLNKIFFVGIIMITMSAFTSIGVYRYAPLSFLEGKQTQKFGTTAITTINGSDQISASRTTINNNFSSLNSNKVEISDLAATTSLKNLLIPVGQITGTLPVANGGTASTTISANQVIIGNGASGFNEVNGFGTSGQFLTSGGAGVAPTWSSNTLDTTLSFNWTGTKFLVQNFYASSTVANPFYLNGLSYDTPSSRAASSTVLSEDGNGNLSWENQAASVLSLNGGINTITGNTSSTTVASYTLPANTLKTNGQLRITTFWISNNGGSRCFAEINIGNWISTTTKLAFQPGNANSPPAKTDMTIMASSTVGFYGYIKGIDSSVNSMIDKFFTSPIDLTQTIHIDFISRGDGTSQCGVLGNSIELLRI